VAPVGDVGQCAVGRGGDVAGIVARRGWTRREGAGGAGRLTPRGSRTAHPAGEHGGSQFPADRDRTIAQYHQVPRTRAGRYSDFPVGKEPGWGITVTPVHPDEVGAQIGDIRQVAVQDDLVRMSCLLAIGVGAGTGQLEQLFPAVDGAVIGEGPHRDAAAGVVRDGEPSTARVHREVARLRSGGGDGGEERGAVLADGPGQDRSGRRCPGRAVDDGQSRVAGQRGQGGDGRELRATPSLVPQSEPVQPVLRCGPVPRDVQAVHRVGP
jgi:hypothetical protein